MERSIPSQYLLILIGLVAERGCALDVICDGTNLSLEVLGQAGTRVDEAEADRGVEPGRVAEVQMMNTATDSKGPQVVPAEGAPHPLWGVK